MRRRTSLTLLIGAALLSGAACNSIFGIQGGNLGSGGGAGAGASSASTAAGSTSGSAGGGATTASTTATVGSTTGSAVGSTGASTTGSTSGTGGGDGGVTGCGVGVADAGAPGGQVLQVALSTSASQEAGADAVFDAAGDLFVGGSFDSVTLGFSTTGDVHNTLPSGNWNGFVAKFDPSGVYQWGFGVGGTDGSAWINAVALAPDGHVWAVGTFFGTLPLGGQTYVANGDDTVTNRDDIFIVELDAKGQLILGKAFVYPEDQEALGLAIDSTGAVYVSGIGYDVYGFGKDPVGVSTEWTSFLLKLDPGGVTEWDQTLQSYPEGINTGFYTPNAMAVAVDKDDAPIVAAGFYGSQTIVSHLVSAYADDALVLKFNGTGGLTWAATFHGDTSGDGGGDGDQWATSVTTDPCSGDVLVTGGFTRSIDLGGAVSRVTLGNQDDADMWVARLKAADGSVVWGKAFGDAGWQQATVLRADHAGNVVLGGQLEVGSGAGVAFGPNVLLTPAANAAQNTDSTDSFLVKLDIQSGNALWGDRLEGAEVRYLAGAACDLAGRTAVVGTADGTLLLPGMPALDTNYFDAFAIWYTP